MKLVNIGYGNMVSAERIITIVSSESAPIKRLIQEARDDGRAIDATYGRKTRAVIIMDSGHIILSSLITETLAARINGMGGSDDDEYRQTHSFFRTVGLRKGNYAGGDTQE